MPGTRSVKRPNTPSPDVAPRHARYIAQERVGVGAMGAVYLGRDALLERPVALKFITTAGDAESARQAALDEARVVASVEHPHIVRVLDVTEDEGRVLVVFERLEGEDLRAVLRRRGRLGVREALDVVIPIADALCASHARGVVHRDVKPENIFIARRGDAMAPTLIDFGIASPHGAHSGTPRYMAPECLLGGLPCTDRGDVWALGAVLYECIAGRPPYLGDNAAELTQEHLAGDAPPLRALAPDTPQDVEALVVAALARNASSRTSAMVALHASLVAARARSRPHRLVVVGALAAIMAAALALAGSSPRDRAARRPGTRDESRVVTAASTSDSLSSVEYQPPARAAQRETTERPLPLSPRAPSVSRGVRASRAHHRSVAPDAATTSPTPSETGAFTLRTHF